jgi:hypothetical protein
VFKNDFKGRLRFASKLVDWQLLEAEISGRSTEGMHNGFLDKLGSQVADGHMTHEHFSSKKSEMARLLEAAYFPVIDTEDQKQLYTRESDAIAKETDKIHD